MWVLTRSRGARMWSSAAPGHLPLDRAGEAVIEERAQALAEVPGAACGVWATVDDRRRDHLAVVPERHQRPARERAVCDPDQLLRELLATRGPVAVEARAVPADVRVEAPGVLLDRAARWRRHADARATRGRAAGARLRECRGRPDRSGRALRRVIEGR